MKKPYIWAVLIILSMSAATTSAQSVQYEYDSLNRLTTATYADGTIVSYTYDAEGNRLSEVIKKPSIAVWTKKLKTRLGVERFQYDTEVSGWACTVNVFPETGDVMLVAQPVGVIAVNSANVTMIQQGRVDNNDKGVFAERCVDAIVTLEAEPRDKITDYLNKKK